MEHNQLVIDNIAIAVFTGYYFDKLKPCGCIDVCFPKNRLLFSMPADQVWKYLENKYSTFNGIMPVIEQIEAMEHIDVDGNWGPYQFELHRSMASFGYGRFRIGDLHKGANRFEHAKLALTAFIKWHNNLHFPILDVFKPD